MSEKYEIVIVGGGHNGLIAGCYLAKAGVKVCVVEKNDKVGGGVMTRELTLPGFKHDVCSVAHTMLQGNPLIQNDELGLMSKFGLSYANPEKMTAIFFDDGTVLEFYSDLERTCQAIAKFSQHDADAYRRFNQKVYQMLDMLVMGMFSVPPNAGVQAAMLDASPEGQEMMWAQSISCWDLIDEWFENEKVKIALARYASESMLNPFDNGTGFGFYIILPYMHKYGSGVPIGGSGALADALVKCFQSHGGTIKTNSPVRQFMLSGNDVTGIVLESGEEILAGKAVISNLHAQQVFPKMVPGAKLPENFQRRISTLKQSSLRPFCMHLALNEAPKYKIGPQVDDFFWVEKCPSNLEEFAQGFRELEFGHLNRGYIGYVMQDTVDKTRAPAGKRVLHMYGFMPYDLKDGGPKKWDVIGKEVADGFLKDLQGLTTNMDGGNILGSAFMTPLDIERHNNSLVGADILHFGAYAWQLGGNRPVPGYGQYKSPLNRLYMSGASTHPGGGVTGGSGRNAAQVVMEDLGLDFERVVG